MEHGCAPAGKPSRRRGRQNGVRGRRCDCPRVDAHRVQEVPMRVRVLAVLAFACCIAAAPPFAALTSAAQAASAKTPPSAAAHAKPSTVKAPPAAAATELIDLNTASKEQLMTLPGI